MTFLIILMTGLVSFLCFNQSALFEKLTFNPYKIKRNGEYYRFVTHGLVHGNMSHLMFNMFSLYFAGSSCETIFSPSIIYIIFYLAAIAISAIPDYIKNQDNPYYSAIGASGGVSAVLFSLVLFDPWGIVNIYFILPLYFILFAVLYLLFSFYMSRRQSDGIGHAAHFYGAIFGIVATMIYRPDSITIFVNELMHPPFLK